MGEHPGPAHRLRSERLVLRCWRDSERDARKLVASISESLDHLRPWMPWARAEPQTLEEKREMIRGNRRKFRDRQDFAFGVFDPEEKRVLGSCGLHDRVGEGGLEIGYWVHAEHVRRGYATEMAAALTRVGFEIEGARRLEIHCDPRNVASAGVPKRLRYRCEETRPDAEPDPVSGRTETQVWVLRASDYPGTPAARTRIEAEDERGRALRLDGRARGWRGREA